MKTLSLILLLSCVALVADASPPTIVHLGVISETEISNLHDLNVVQLDPKAANVVYTANESICIYSSKSTHNYNVTIDSNNSAYYELQNASHVLPITLWWSAQANPENAQQLTPNRPLLVQNSSASVQPNCPNGLNADLQLRINSDQLSGIPSGAYSATLEVIVTAAN
ncbi:MAG: hypothetical protein EXR81_05220 [Gammaproteobacteria bacterium]|nr:hypothetical protein [Gammaproteobacteria bacterium]